MIPVQAETLFHHGETVQQQRVPSTDLARGQD